MTRQTLPNRRPSEIYPAKTMGGRKMFIGIGRDQNGNIKEIFIDVSRTYGTPVKDVFHIFATTISIALQYGAPVELIIKSIREQSTNSKPEECWTKEIADTLEEANKHHPGPQVVPQILFEMPPLSPFRHDDITPEEGEEGPGVPAPIKPTPVLPSGEEAITPPQS